MNTKAYLLGGATSVLMALSAPAFGQGSVEVLNWWTSGGEAAAMDELISAFKQNNPDMEFTNAAIAGGGGSVARGVLQTRLAGGTPPQSWPAHPGNELMGQYVDPGFAAPLGDLYREEAWADVIPEGLVDMMSRDGEPYGVLVGIHRGNGFWYNKKVLEENGVSVGDALEVDEFFTIADTLQAAGVTPLCVGDNGIWASAELLENTLVGVLGADSYNALWDGSLAFDDASVVEAISVYGRMLDYQNSDHAALSWDQAVKKVISGDCAFNSMGDWAYGEFVAAGLTDNEEFGWVSHPGSQGIFVVVGDGFVMAEDAEDKAGVTAWLRTIGSREAQEAFSQKKGSICPRTDCDRAQFGAYHNWAMDSFGGDALVPTVVHGSAAPADFQQALNDAVTLYVVDRNADQLASALTRAARDSGFAN